MKGTQILMHKETKVATCSFDSRGYLKSVSKVHSKNHLPVCVRESSLMLDMQRWILARNLATNRRDIAPLREFYGSSAFQTSTGISLFDCYWFANDEHKDWEKENAFDNWNCKKDSLYLMLTHPEELRIVDTSSPNLTIPGRAQRIWYRAGEDLCLLYGNAQKEVGEFRKANGNPVVGERSYAILAGQIFALTKAETSQDVERISLEDFYNSCQNPEKTKMQNLQICCENFGIPKWREFLAAMCDFDEAIGNDNRELCDIGVLRDSNTLEIIGFSKI